jgi:release factor glutamine methyltransferase
MDIGTGSGAIAVALAREQPGAAVVASDRSWAALQVARRNARRHGVSERVALVQGDLLEMIAGPVALVASNPPYIAQDERDSLMPEVRDHEPAGALFAGPTGMEAIERIVARAGRLLAPGGWLVMEIDSRRSGQVASLLARDAIWQNVVVRDDYAGLPRVARARRRS